MRSVILFLSIAFLVHVAQQQDDRITVSGRNGMVVTASPPATDVGVEILRRGGNAVDAAVAVGFALAVTYPSAGNIGGSTYMIIHMADGREAAIDARETAPQAAHRDMYLDENGEVLANASLLGPLAAGVPGTVDGLLTALERYGSMERKEVLRPAIRLAEEGFVPHRRLSALMTSYADSFRLFPSTAVCFLPDGKAPRPDRPWKQSDLASTLRSIAEKGRDGFYRGDVARRIHDAMERDGGIITMKDLAGYRCIEREPLRASYRGHDVLTMPPSSSGGVALLQMLALFERYPRLSAPNASYRSAHILVEAMRRAFADRAVYMGDPDFIHIPVDSLLSPGLTDAWLVSIDTMHATRSKDLPHGDMLREHEQTTHFVVLDRHGNAVSVTTTLNSSFGGMYIVEGTGVLLNNEMDDFSIKPGVPNQFGLLGGEANSIVPGKRMLSSMTPTIVLRDGKPRLLTGSPGGSKIITSVLQTIINCIDFDMPLSRAIANPRFHHQFYPDRIEYERGAFTNATREKLVNMGHGLVQVRSFGRVEGIWYESESGVMSGVSDPRGYGRAAAVAR
jgi:gamma-glutamyltranspeptidase / glutathione hydrolase